MPLGWRPADIVEKFPVYKIKDVYHFEKYDPKVSSGLLNWSWVQMTMMLLLISYLFGNIAKIGSPGMFWYGGFVFLSIYAYTELLDRSKYAIVWEILKNALGLSIIYVQKDWFDASQLMAGLQYFLATYFVFSTVMSAWWVYKNLEEDKQGPLKVSGV